VLLEKKGKARSVVHYVLKKSVRIPGVGYLEAARDAAAPQIEEIMNVEIQKSADEVG
jgi:hypothetical protein